MRLHFILHFLCYVMHRVADNGSLFFLKKIKYIDSKVRYYIAVAGALQYSGYFKSIFLKTSFTCQVKYFLKLSGIAYPGAAIFKFYFYNIVLVLYFNLLPGSKAPGIAYCY